MTKLYTWPFHPSKDIETIMWLCTPGVRFDGVTINANHENLVSIENYIDRAKRVSERTGAEIGISLSPWHSDHPENPLDIQAEEISREINLYRTNLEYIKSKCNISYILVDYEKWKSYGLYKDVVKEEELNWNRAIGVRYNLIWCLLKFIFPEVKIYHYAEFAWRNNSADHHWYYVEEKHTEVVSCSLYYPTHLEWMQKILNLAIKKSMNQKEVIPHVALGAGYGSGPDENGKIGFKKPWDYPIEYSKKLGKMLRGFNTIVYPPPIKSFEEETIYEKHLNAFISEYRRNINTNNIINYIESIIKELNK